MLEQNVTDVKAAVCPNSEFSVGLRLSGVAAAHLARDPDALVELRCLLQRKGLHVSTINAFPYGPFHGEAVKERVYLPDWRAPERQRYTTDVANVLANLLQDERAGSISTVPGAFRKNADTAEALETITDGLLEMVQMLAALEESSGKSLVLALEPEPACLLETTDDAISFFETQLLSSHARSKLRALGCAQGREEQLVRKHLGVCLDTCHAAVEFEPALVAYERYAAAGIVVPKIQVSAGLVLDPADAAQLRALHDFDEPVYLHQVVARSDDHLRRFDDLPQAFSAAPRAPGDEWRVHFHVPLFTDAYGAFSSSRAEITPLLDALAVRDDCPLLEVETYTWDVLPERFRVTDVASAISRELSWVRQQMEQASRP